jgi:rare lipoprotein A
LPVRAVVAIATPPQPPPQPDLQVVAVGAPVQPPPRNTIKVADNRPMAPPASTAPDTRPVIIDELPESPPPLVLPATISMEPVKPTQIYIQAGAFAEADNARRLQDRLRVLGSPVSIKGAAVNGISVYRVRVGPIASVDAADAMLGRVVSDGFAQARIVVD